MLVANYDTVLHSSKCENNSEIGSSAKRWSLEAKLINKFVYIFVLYITEHKYLPCLQDEV
jgi:hypothetical protein